MDDLETDRCTCKACKPDPLWRPSDAFYERPPKTATVAWREVPVDGVLIIQVIPLDGVGEVPS